MAEYEVPGLDQIEVQLVILFYVQILIPPPLKKLSKKKSEGKQWMKKLQPLKETTLGS